MANPFKKLYKEMTEDFAPQKPEKPDNKKDSRRKSVMITTAKVEEVTIKYMPQSVTDEKESVTALVRDGVLKEVSSSSAQLTTHMLKDFAGWMEFMLALQMAQRKQ